ncbi:hypothetical protein CRG98_039586 [Punica granatum]|uniref:Uncharacterized protein n=1 Tax=Punica granatum TaxID=22663 RepID=A0A2I0I9H4_PUNGR|nr:hypothetical protein CRG98_039586 [Punica granatum]
MGRDTRAVAATKMDTSHDLWLHPLIEPATKEGKLSAPHFDSTALTENSRLELESLFTVRPTEANTRAREHELQKRGSCVPKAGHEREEQFLRSRRNSSLLGTVVGAAVSTSFFPDYHYRYFLGAHCPCRLAESFESLSHFSDSFLAFRG